MSDNHEAKKTGWESLRQELTGTIDSGRIFVDTRVESVPLGNILLSSVTRGVLPFHTEEVCIGEHIDSDNGLSPMYEWDEGPLNDGVIFRETKIIGGKPYPTINFTETLFK